MIVKGSWRGERAKRISSLSPPAPLPVRHRRDLAESNSPIAMLFAAISVPNTAALSGSVRSQLTKGRFRMLR